jgi:site-specific recombinase XerD
MDEESAAAVAADFEQPGSECLAKYVDGFARFLGELGYSPLTIEINKRNFVTRLGRWLERGEANRTTLDEDVLALFHRSHCRHGRPRPGDVRTGRQLLQFLRGAGCIPAPVVRIERSPLDAIMDDFDRFLASQRGLLPVTRGNYLPFVRSFLSNRFGTDVRLGELKIDDVHTFLLRHAQTKSRGTTQCVVTALRSFLRYLQQRGDITIDLARAVPAVANWSLSGVPKFISASQVEQVLASCDLATPAGRRDHAILLLLARLGLRAAEVAALTLDDVDWENGDIIVRGKGKILARLPLPPDVGDALVEYLRTARPACSTRQVFLRSRAPIGSFEKPSAVGCIVRRALRRAGLNPGHKGAHLLRHSLATNLLRHGASLTEIGQVLRHSGPDTTRIYAKVDIEPLRLIATSWPAGAR